ncbi:hypothetical protein ACHAW5_004112 [Stephanodiscus triporus]|uniref:Peptidase M6-like domain-containing protein n=1 Tax=Stephanodiscus triporus TaxID=2934178 RepID=A0ABD3P339_9STRA
MKPSVFLAMTILASLATLAAPTKTSDVLERDGIEANDGQNYGQSTRLPGRAIEPKWNSVIRMVPVPPASTAAAESKPRGRRLTAPEVLRHRPHSAYLNQTIYATERASDGQQRQRGLFHSTNGTFHNLVLLLRFSDHVDRDLPSRADISRLYNSDASNPFAGDDIVPTGSVRQVYESNSYSTLTFETTVVDWITLSKPESYYGNGNNGFTKFKEAIVEALTKLDNSEGGFDFTEFDLDDNGALDGLGILHSGFGAEYGGVDCHGAPSENRIWSHKGGMDEWTSSPEAGGEVVRVNRFYVSSSLRGVCHSNIVRMGVIVHELGHSFGLPDLYDETFDGKGLGAYDFMSETWGWDGSGMYPPKLSAWSKVFLGWAKVEVIAYDGTYELKSSTTSNTVYKIEAGYPEGEYLLIENRQPTGYDIMMEGGGLAIYHIDDKAVAQNNRGYPSSQSDWPRNGKHYQVALLAADGNYDLERGTNNGDSGDLWHYGSELKELRSGSGSHPNTDSYQYGNVTSTGVRIYGFGFSGEIMTFRVDGLGMSAAGTGSVDGVAVSIERIKTPKPTPKPITPKPVTIAPTSPPPTPKPVTKAPIEVTASSILLPSALTQSKMPVTSLPTLKSTPPTSQSQSTSICDNRCLEEIASSECPLTSYELPDCLQVNVGELCDANGECGSNQSLNNCDPFDVYRRINCIATNSSGIATSVNHNNCPYYPGWNSGFSHCLNDCLQPEFMRSNPTTFEFDSIEECCLLHYEGEISCLTDSVLSNFTTRL